MTKTLRVGIVGGGIGGVALARALALRGIEAHVFERAPAFGEIGAGVQMTPNAAKVLRALGLGDELQRIGFLPQAMVGRNWEDARELFRTPLREVCPRLFGADFWHVHRADLHAILCSGIPADRVRFNVVWLWVRQIAHTATPAHPHTHPGAMQKSVATARRTSGLRSTAGEASACAIPGGLRLIRSFGTWESGQRA